MEDSERRIAELLAAKEMANQPMIDPRVQIRKELVAEIATQLNGVRAETAEERTLRTMISGIR